MRKISINLPERPDGLDKDPEYEKRAALIKKEEKRKKKQNAGDAARKATAKLIRDIKKHIKSEGGMAARVNTTGMFDKKTGKWKKSGSDTVADIVAAKRKVFGLKGTYGVSVFIECKANKGDKLNERQIKHKNEVLKAGGFFIEAQSFDQFKEEWNEI